ncbi:hypothetical protein CAB17_09050 [Legionella sainthelensi]|uniref:Nucleoside 2-deoxyribosyltransferase n=2 Tax=Legionella sainthelensi TaxID=28087 RepID=A0A2H5FKX8_9GAMM|nr:hypothetical protein CAB17_09050 [Legionella sainthelensi]
MDIMAEAETILSIIHDLTGEKPGEYVPFKDILFQYELKGNEFFFEEKNIQYLLGDCLTKELQYIEEKNTSGNRKYKITPKGYVHIHNLLTDITESNTGFCAMWFNAELKEVWDKAIKKAIEESNYRAIRIDEEHFNDDINSKMIILINSCKFVIADFTGNRGGVYFEAGYAHGLKKPVIYTCEKNYFSQKKPHFDIEHYNFILWNDKELDVFKNTLQARIVTTVV